MYTRTELCYTFIISKTGEERNECKELELALSHGFQHLQIGARTKLNFQDETELPHELFAENPIFLSTALTRNTLINCNNRGKNLPATQRSLG